MAHVSVPMRSEVGSPRLHAPQRPLPPHLRHEQRSRGTGEDGGGVVPPEEVPIVHRVGRRGAAQRPELGEDPATRKNGLGRRLDRDLKLFLVAVSVIHTATAHKKMYERVILVLRMQCHGVDMTLD